MTSKLVKRSTKDARIYSFVFSNAYAVALASEGIFDSIYWGVIPLGLKSRELEDVMEVPEDIQHRYMERRKKDLEICLYNFELENFTELEKVGHQLKGNGETFGFPELSSIGIHLEEAAATQDHSQIESAIKELSRWVKNHIN